MSIDEWELMAREFDRLLKEATDNGMTTDEFRERMAKLSWEWEELDRLHNRKKDEDTENP